MTTQSWSTVISQATDAAFRVWGDELRTKLAATGLVRTADTGQIDWTTVTRAAINTDAGYEIWRFDDVQQATAPIFLRLGYGSGSVTSRPRLRLEVGTGTDGAGTITGTAKTANTITTSTGAPLSAVTAYQSYAATAEGFCGLIHKAGAIGAVSALAGFAIARTCGTTGVADATGAIVLFYGATNCLTHCLRFAATASAQTVGTTGGANMVFVPGYNATSAVGTDLQAYTAWGSFPRVQPVAVMCGIFDSELTLGNTLSVAMVGTSARTFLQAQRQIGTPAQSSVAANMGLAILWE